MQSVKRSRQRSGAIETVEENKTWYLTLLRRRVCLRRKTKTRRLWLWTIGSKPDLVKDGEAQDQTRSGRRSVKMNLMVDLVDVTYF